VGEGVKETGLGAGHGDGGLQGVLVEEELHGAGTERSHLAQHYILGYAVAPVDFAVASSLEQNLDGLFKGAAHQSRGISTVDAMSGNAHQISLGGHDITEQGQMAVVYIGTVGLDDLAEFPQDGPSGALNPQDLVDFKEVVGEYPAGIDARMAHHSQQPDALRLQDPLVFGLKLSRGLVDGDAFAVDQENPSDALDTAEDDRVKHARLNLLQEDIFFDPAAILAVNCGSFLGFVDDATAQD
jgi:hypothetical protein